MEIWKNVKGYEGYYQVSNKGRVRSIDRVIPDGRKYKGCIRVLCNDKDGYPYVVLAKNGKNKTLKIHRLVATTFIPNPQNKYAINHIDGNKENNSVENLEWVTQSENELHAHRTGLKISIKGEQHKLSKLTEKEVLEIREKYIPKKYSLTKLAKEYNVCFQLISQIVNRKIWKHI